MDTSRLQASKKVQLTFVVLLLTCLGQVAWWVYDQGVYGLEVNRRVVDLARSEAAAAERMVEEGVAPEVIYGIWPHLQPGPDGHPRLREEDLARLEAERHDRMVRYGWEGSFFVAVLLSAIALVLLTLRARTELLRRQQNFLAAVSHELKSPLASLKLSAETLLLRDPEPATRRKVAERMVRSADRLAAMVRNVLDAARLDEGRADSQPEHLELAEAVRRAAEPLTCATDLRGVDLRLEVPEDLSLVADPNGVQAVIGNLLSNAVKSVEAAGGGTITVTGERDGARVRLEVSDTGLGFDPAQARRIFEKFYRTGDELVRRTKGAGLGLHIAKRMIENDGGRIEGSSEGEGRGATFRVWWRAAGTPGAEAAGSEQA